MIVFAISMYRSSVIIDYSGDSLKVTGKILAAASVRSLLSKRDYGGIS